MKKNVIILAIASCILLSGCAINQQQTNQSSDEMASAADINISLGFAYLNSGDVVKAKEKLLLAQHQAPNNSAVWYALGYFQEQTGDLVQANRSYLQAIKFAPKNGAAQNNYGTFLCRHGQYATAIQHFLLAIQDPAYLTVGEAYENAGLCAQKMPNLQLAQQYFTKALQYNPKSSKALFHLAELSYEQGQHAAANDYLQRYKQTGLITPDVIKFEEKLAGRN